jgi:hypothetical protein
VSELVFEIESGERFEFSVELVHGLPMTITEDNNNINGVNWAIPGDPVVIVEGVGRLTAPDGTVLHGFQERSARRSALPRPEVSSSTKADRRGALSAAGT